MKPDRRNAQFLHGHRSNVLSTLQWDVCVDTHTHTHTHTHTSPALQNKWKRSYFTDKPSCRVYMRPISQNDAIRCCFFPAAMTLHSIHMSDTYFNTQEPMERIGQSDRIELKQQFCFEGRIWDWWLSLWKMCDWVVEWGLERRMWGTETRRYGVGCGVLKQDGMA